MKRKRSILITAMLMAMLCYAYAAGKEEGPSGLRIVSTTNIVADVVANIAGDRGDLAFLVGIGRDPHGFEPAPRDIARVEKADIVFVNGFELEETLLRIVRSVNSGAIVEVSHGVIPLEDDEHHEDDHGEYDPHTWMSPLNVVIWADNIARALSEKDPEGKAYYTANAEAYKFRLGVLDKDIRQMIEEIPGTSRKLITDHLSFGYFCRDYGFTQTGAILAGFSTGMETSPRDIARLARLIEQERTPAIFIGSTAGEGTRRLAEALNTEPGSDVRIVELLTGSLTGSGTAADSYIGFIRYNVEQIVKGLR